MNHEKIITILLTILFTFSLAACQKAEPKTVTLHIEDAGIISQYTMEAEGWIVSE